MSSVKNSGAGSDQRPRAKQMDAVVISVLKEMGGAGAVIAVLLGVISVLSGVIAKQYSDAQKVYKYRLAERDTLNKALSDNTVVLTELCKVMQQRNDTTGDLAEAIRRQAQMFESMSDRTRMNFEVYKDDQRRIEDVIGAISEAMRNVVGLVEQIKAGYAGTVRDLRKMVAGMAARNAAARKPLP
jgi:hypothetical protein